MLLQTLIFDGILKELSSGFTTEEVEKTLLLEFLSGKIIQEFRSEKQMVSGFLRLMFIPSRY